MGNRAIIIPREPTEGKPVAGIYVHWNGGICVVTKEKWDEAKEDKYTYDNGVYCLGEGWTVAERRGGFSGTKTKLEELDEDERKKYEAIVKHILSGKLVHEGEDEDEEE